MVKQRRATRRDAMAAKKGNSRYDQQKRNLKLIITAVGIATCVVIGIYFSFSAPEAGTTREVRNDDDAWHEMKNNWSVRPLSPKKSNLITEAIDVERLKNEYLRNFMVVRMPGSKNIKKVEKFVTTTLENLGYEIELDTFKDSPPKSYSQKRVSFTNIVATHDPYARRRLVLACHYDSKVTPVGFLGATDSAVPCAILLEIAKSLEPYMVKGTDLTLQLIFFDGEEAFVTWTAQDSIYGSRHLAQTWQSQNWPPGSNGDKNRLHSIDLFVLLDLLGEKDPSFYDIRNIHKSGHYKDIVRIEKNLQDGLVYFNQKSVSYYVEDDHIPFHKRDVPILHIIPKPFPANWHKITDDGTNIHDPTVERLTKILAVFSAEYLHLEPFAS